MRSAANATLIPVEAKLSAERFHSRVVIRSVVERAVSDSEAEKRLILSLLGQVKCWSCHYTCLEDYMRISYLQLRLQVLLQYGVF